MKKTKIPDEDNGRVVQGTESVPWVVLDEQGEEITDYSRFLADVQARHPSPRTVRSYAFALLRADRVWRAFGVPRDRVGRTEISDLCRWMDVARNPQRRRAPGSRFPRPGAFNALTGKRYLSQNYAPRTINHQLSVISEYWEWRVEEGLALANPVPRAKVPGGGGDPNHGTSPLEPYRNGKRAPYRRRVKSRPRRIPDAHLKSLFEAITNKRDWALVYLMLWSAPRGSEAINLTRSQLDPEGSVVWVARKGHGGELSAVPAVPVWFDFVDSYLEDLADRGVVLEPDEPLWRTLIGEDRPVGYQTVRKAFQRANQACGFNYTLHDLRHTGAHRMVNDPAMTIRDVQAVLGHASLNTTMIYTEPTVPELVAKVIRHHDGTEQRRAEAAALTASASVEYDPTDIDTLFREPR